MKSEFAPAAQHPLTRFVSVAAAVFVGVAGGLLVHDLIQLAESPRVLGDSVPSTFIDPALVDALKALAAEFRDRRVASSNLVAPSPDSQRTIATESGEGTIGELAVAVRELRTALRDGRTSVPITTSPVIALPYEQARKLLPDLPAGETDRSRAYTRHHLLWTEQQVLDRYGQPSVVWNEGDQERWGYCDEREKSLGFTFAIYQGRVVQVFAQ